MTAEQLDIIDDTGRINRAALAGVDQAAENTDSWWRDCADRALATLAAGGRDFSAEDLRTLGVPEPDHPARWGAIFRRAAGAGLIEEVGARRSTTATRRASLVRVWRGTAAVRTGGAA